MLTVLDELDLTDLVTTILAETGDLIRFDSARAMVKHAGLCPRENASGSDAGKATISGRDHHHAHRLASPDRRRQHRPPNEGERPCRMTRRRRGRDELDRPGETTRV